MYTANDPFPASNPPNPHGDPFRPNVPERLPEPEPNAVPRGELHFPVRVYRVTGRRGPVQVVRDISARGASAAIRTFVDLTGADHIDSTRKLRRDPDTKRADSRNSTAARTAKIRRQRDARERRALKYSGLK
jgi:hypothetical protein